MIRHAFQLARVLSLTKSARRIGWRRQKIVTRYNVAELVGTEPEHEFVFRSHPVAHTWFRRPLRISLITILSSILLDTVEHFGKQLSGTCDDLSVAKRNRINSSFDFSAFAFARRRHRVEYTLARKEQVSRIIHRRFERRLLQIDSRRAGPFSSI